ncbi:MAG: hypothetical protein Kow0089_14100 [Desulfobulbaceae bacterium]
MLVSEWDQEEKNLHLDEWYLRMGNQPQSGHFLQVGRFQLPFASADGDAISSPLTREVFETKAKSVRAGYFSDGVFADIYIFQGDHDREQAGGRIGYTMKTVDGNLTSEVGLITMSRLDDPEPFETLKQSASQTPALSVSTSWNLGLLSFNAAYITIFQSPAEKYPAAYHFEGTYHLPSSDPKLFLALGYSRIHKLSFHPSQERATFTTGIELTENTAFYVEYCHQNYGGMIWERENVGESGKNAAPRDMITVQIKFEF